MANYYVDPARADDSGDGLTVGAAKKTIDAAYVAATTAGSGNTLKLIQGTYDNTTQGNPWQVDIDITDKDITIEPNNVSDTITLTPNNISEAVKIDCDGSVVVFNNLTIIYNSADGVWDHIIKRNTDKTADITFTDCILTMDGSAAAHAIMTYGTAVGTTPVGSLTFDGCTITCNTSSTAVNPRTLATLTVNNTSITNTIGGGIVVSLYLFGTIKIIDSTIIANQTGKVAVVILAGFPAYCGGTVIVRNSTLTATGTAFGATEYYLDRIIIDGCILSTNGTSGQGSVLKIGGEVGDAINTDWAVAQDYSSQLGNLFESFGRLYRCTANHNPSTSADKPETGANWRLYWTRVIGPQCTITNNTISNSTAGVHALLLGMGISYAEVADNYLFGGDWQLVVKGGQNSIHHNILSGANPLALHNYAGNKVFNNTCYATSSNCFALRSLATGGDSLFTQDNAIFNNIFYSTSAAGYCLTDNSNSGDGNENVNYNCYYNEDPGDNWFHLGGATRATLALLRTRWASVAQGNISFGAVNDQNSIDLDPLFIDAANGDFRLRENSPCLNAGMPARNGASGYGKTTMGGWQPNALPIAVSRPRYAGSPIYE